MYKLFLIGLLFSVNSFGQNPLKKLLRQYQSPIGPTTYLQDDFVGVNGTVLTSHTMDIGSGWTFADGTGCGAAGNYTIQSNKAQPPNNSVRAITWAEAGFADVVASVIVTTPNTTTFLSGLIIRYSDCQNYIAAVLEDDGSGAYIYFLQKAAGVSSSYGIVNVTGAVNATLTLTATLSANTITFTTSNGDITSATVTFNNSATKFGLISFADGATYLRSVFSNFLVTN